MFSVRLPGALVGQVVERAEEEDVSQADLVERALGEWLDAQDAPRPTDMEDAVTADEATRAGLTQLAEFLQGHGHEPRRLVVAAVFDDGRDGAIAGFSRDPVELLGDLIHFATITAGSIGRTITVREAGCE